MKDTFVPSHYDNPSNCSFTGLLLWPTSRKVWPPLSSLKILLMSLTNKHVLGFFTGPQQSLWEERAAPSQRPGCTVARQRHSASHLIDWVADDENDPLISPPQHWRGMRSVPRSRPAWGGKGVRPLPVILLQRPSLPRHTSLYPAASHEAPAQQPPRHTGAQHTGSLHSVELDVCVDVCS